MPLIMLLTGSLTGLSAGLAPGPLMALIVSESLQNGWKRGLPLAFVPVLTDGPIVLIALYMATKALDTRYLFTAMSFAGGAYLIWLGVGELRSKSTPQQIARTGNTIVFRGCLVNILSPHPWLFWITVGVPIIIKGGGVYALPPWMFVLGFYSAMVAAKALMAISLGKLKAKIHLDWLNWIHKCMAGVLMAFGIWLLGEGIAIIGGYSGSNAA